MLTLPCLSLKQPWAWLVTDGGKSIENRTWNTRFRGTFLIQASKGMKAGDYDDARSFALDIDPESRFPEYDQLARGGIVGAARIVEVWEPTSNSQNPWHMPDQFGFELADVTPLPFRPFKGRLGFFNVELTPEEHDVLTRAGLLDVRRVG